LFSKFNADFGGRRERRVIERNNIINENNNNLPLIFFEFIL
jgi:hypothetical protein